MLDPSGGHGLGVQWMSAKLLVNPFSRCMLGRAWRKGVRSLWRHNLTRDNRAEGASMTVMERLS